MTTETRDDPTTSAFAIAGPGAARGHTIGRYVVLSRVGAGAMGEVFAAYDPELDRKVALKLMRPDFDAPAHGPSRLMREAQAMARLNHPNVIAIHDVGEHRGRVFLAMEFIEGTTLRAWLEAETRAWREVIDVFVRAGRGLAAAHEKGLVHRDFKPDNVMIGSDARVRVMDFGLARPVERPEHDDAPEDETRSPTEEDRPRPRADALESDITIHGAVIGTPAYMAPEQHLGRPVDARTDQFAFCVALWEALHGQRPFRGDTLEALAFNVTRGERVPPPATARIPSVVRLAIERGLAKEPDARHPSMHALLDALTRDPTKRRRRVAFALGTGLVAVVAIAGYQADRARRIAGCAESAARVADLVDAAAPRIESSFAATEASFAAASAARIVPRLRDHAEAWREVANDWCLAETVEHRDPELVQLARACLDEREDAIGSLAELLQQADREAVRRSAQAVESLPRVASCEDETWLRQRVPPPRDESTREVVRALRGKLTRVSAQAGAGRFAEALAALSALRPEVEAVQFPALLSEVDYHLGMLQERTGDFPSADASLMRALLSATESGHDEVAAQAAALLVTVVGARQARPEEGLRWGELSRAILSRLHLDDGVTAARVANAIGALYHARGEYELALGEFQRSLDIRERRLGSDHFDVAESLNNLGGIHFARQRYDLALECNQRALAIREAALGPDHPDVGSSRNNLGSVLLAQGDTQGALPYLRRALEIWEAAYGPSHPHVVAALNNLGTVLRKSGDLEGAAATMRHAVAVAELSQGLEHPIVAKPLDGLGEVLLLQADTEGAAAVLARALFIREKTLPVDHPEIADVLIRLADVETARQDPQAALRRLEAALAIRERSDVGPIDLAGVRFATARARWDTAGDHASARALARAAREAFAAAGAAGEPHVQSVDRWLSEHP